jgi:hypothetical protein
VRASLPPAAGQADEGCRTTLQETTGCFVSEEHDETQYRIEPLGHEHDRAACSCGVEALDRYLQKQAGQDVTRRAAAAFVITPDGRTIAWFYTLSAHLGNLADLPEIVAKRLPRDRNVPATLPSRLAVSEFPRSENR